MDHGLVTANQSRPPLPYYGPVKAFLRAIDFCKDNGTPAPFTIKAMKEVTSDAIAQRIVSGFTALGWIDSYGRPSTDFLALVEARGTENWTACLREVVQRAYRFLSGYDLKTATLDQLVDVFQQHVGRTDKSITRAVLFYAAIATEAGIEINPAFKHRVRIAFANRDADEDKEHVTRQEDAKEMPGLQPSAGIPAPVSPLLQPHYRSGDRLDFLLAFTEEADEMNEREKAAVITLLAYVRRKQRGH
jgi:hypothetical protein